MNTSVVGPVANSVAVRLSCLAVIFVAGLIGSADAAFISYTDRSSFRDARGGAPDFFLDLEEFGSDTSFRTSGIDLGPFTIQPFGTGSAPVGQNLLDRFPYQSSEIEGNGTTVASLFTRTRGFVPEVAVELVFDAPIFAWGADFTDFGAGEQATQIRAFSADITAPPVSNNLGFNGFYGFTSDQAFTRLLFITPPAAVNNPPAIFSIDNIEGSFLPPGTGTPTPPATEVIEPSSLALLGIAFLGLGIRRRSGLGKL